MEEIKKSKKTVKRRRRRGRKKAGILTNIILVAAIAVFCVSAYQLYKIFKGYYDGRSTIRSVKLPWEIRSREKRVRRSRSSP